MFNINLYKEGLRRTLFIAALFLAITLLTAILIPVGTISGHARAVANGWVTGPTSVSGLALNPLLVLVPFFMAPILSLFQFAFLNGRHSSDFYHSLPHKRSTLWGSYLLAILTWVGLSLLLGLLIPLGIYQIFAANVVMVHFNVMILLGLFAGTLLVVAVTLMAMSLTGSAFSNIVTTGLILFLPRTVLTAFTLLVQHRTPFIPMESFGIWGDIGYQIPFGLIASFGRNPGDILVQGFLYTLILALLYLVAAFFLFVRRKSEAAGQPAQSRLVQNAIRIAVAFVVCLPATAIITSGDYGHGDWIILFAVYCMAVIAYFAYELITTKKFGNLKRALPGLGVLLALNLLFTGGVHITQNALLRNDVNPQEIQSVRIHSDISGQGSWNTPSYETLHLQEVAITDEAIISLFTRALNEQMAIARGEMHWRSDGWSFQAIRVSFTGENGREFDRIIRLGGVARMLIIEDLSQNPQYRDLFFAMPEAPSSAHASQAANFEDRDAMLEIYQILREEVMELIAQPQGLVLWGQALQHVGWHHHDEEPLDISLFAHLSVGGFVNGRNYHSSYPITNLTPRAARAYIDYVNQRNAEDTIAFLQSALAGNLDIDHWNFSSVYSQDPVFISRHTGLRNDFEFFTMLLEAIENPPPVLPGQEWHYYSMHLSAWDFDAQEWIQTDFFLRVDRDVLESFL